MADGEVLAGDPRRSRPRMPAGYGIDVGSEEGMLEWREVAERLEQSRNYWVATTRPDGRPHTMPVWGLWWRQSFYFSTDPTSRKGRNLAANPTMVVHLESGDDVVIVEGRVEEVADQAELAAFADRYEQKYAFRPEPGNPAHGVYRLRPRVAHSWLEKDFPKTATRWEF